MKQKDISKQYLFTNKDLVRLIVPLIIEQFLALLVGMADSIMITSVGEAAVSGVSLVDQIMVLLISAFSALATGGVVIAGQYLGKKDRDGACLASTQLVWFVTISSLILTAAVYLGRNLILHGVFGQIEADVMGHANIYLLIVSASIPFIALYNCGAAIFRAMGNSKISMKVSILMNGINVVGNAILIYGFHCGAEGVAIPTLISRIVAAVIITIMLLNDKWELHIARKLSFHPNWPLIGKMLGIGIPNGLENSMFQLGKVLVLSLVSTFGTSAIAANAVGNILALFECLPGLAMGLAFTTVISRCVGAGDYKQVKYYTRKLMFITYSGIVIMCLTITLLLPVLIKIYNLSEVTGQITSQIAICHAIGCALIWPISFSIPTIFRACGDARYCMVVSILSMWIFRIGCSYLLGAYLGFGVLGVWMSMIIDWIFRSICFTIHYFRGRWRKAALV